MIRYTLSGSASGELSERLEEHLALQLCRLDSPRKQVLLGLLITLVERAPPRDEERCLLERMQQYGEAAKRRGGRALVPRRHDHVRARIDAQAHGAVGGGGGVTAEE